MAHRLVEAAFRARLAAGFSGCQIYPKGKTAAPSNGAAFLVLQFPHSTSMQASVGDPGNNRYREEGGARFVLNVKSNSAPAIAQGDQWCEEIAELFRGKRFDGVLTFAPGSPTFDDESDNAGYFTMSFAVPYLFNFIE
jgi:hypothetical protein